MNGGSKKSSSNGFEKVIVPEEQQAKINELRKLLGPVPERLSGFCSDAAVLRYLRARNWHVKKATKMLKETLKWRFTYRPEEIRWEDIAHEAETGKIYRSTCKDKHGRPVLIMTPGRENSQSTKGKIQYLVYSMENAIQSLPADQEQMVWLIDYQGFNLSHISVKVTQETAHVLQEHYPERLGVAVLYNPPKFFEPFYKLVKPFLEPKTRNKVKFVYSDDPNTMKILEEIFDMDQLATAFGGKNDSGFNVEKYAEMMRQDDAKRLSLPPVSSSDDQFFDCDNLHLASDGSESERAEAVDDESADEKSSLAYVSENETTDNSPVAGVGTNGAGKISRIGDVSKNETVKGDGSAGSKKV